MSAGVYALTYVDGLFSICLLNDTDSGVGDENEENDQRFDKGCHPRSSRLGRVFETRQDERHDGRGEENEDELIFELSEDQGEQRGGRSFR